MGSENMEKYKMLIGGDWSCSTNNEYISSINPFNLQEWAQIPQGTESDVNKAVSAARYSYAGWGKTSGLERANLMIKLADLLDKNAETIAALESTDNGKIIRETKSQMHFAARSYRYFAGYADKLIGEQIPLDNDEILDYTLREPLGVVALIISWNSPMQILSNKLAPALAAGNTVVIKPSEYASVTTLEFGKLVEQAGFPNGVVNIVTGDGKVGDLLTKSKGIDKISFTGGTETGEKIAENASRNLIPVTLELGGKSPNIIFNDADLNKAINGAMAGIFGASGQSCIAGARLLVQESIYQKVIDELINRVKKIRLGDPLNPEIDMGPVASEAQYNKILSMIRTGEQQGAEKHTGGEFNLQQSEYKGYFIRPTFFTNVSNKMTIAQQEIFGPVLSMIPFTDENEALSIANDSQFGLTAGVWTRDIARAHRLSKKIESGTVWVNMYRSAAAQAPFGGIKKSGYGKERSHHALLEYTKIKNVMIDLSEVDYDPFKIRT